jgi:hypothetical protein
VVSAGTSLIEMTSIVRVSAGPSTFRPSRALAETTRVASDGLSELFS